LTELTTFFSSILEQQEEFNQLNLIIPAICFSGAYISTVAGLGGGLLILSTTSLLLPLSVVIPLNGVLILAGQLARAWQFRQYMVWSITLPFIPGSIIGAFLGSKIYFELSEAWIALILGCVMFWMTWMPRTSGMNTMANSVPKPWFWIGIFHTLFSTISGAGGLMQTLMANSSFPRQNIVAIIAGSLLFMAIFKSAAYLYEGFNYGPYISLIGLCWIAGIIGTTLGTRTLHRLPEKLFRALLKAAVTIFSFRLLWIAWNLF
jgi:uncharacterized membrane protein YfcA